MLGFRRIFSAGIWGLTLLSANLLSAFPVPVDPAPRLERSVESVLDLLYPEPSAETEQSAIQLEQIILAELSAQYNLDIIIRRSLGRNWNKIDSEHRSKILELIKQLVVRAYVEGMKGRSRPSVQFEATEFLSNMRCEVPTQVNFDELKVSLNYRLGWTEGRWEIFDLVIEGISIAVNYRNQFDAFFANSDSLALIQKLESLLTDENLGKALDF